MSANLYGQFTGRPMDEDDVEALLEDQGYGVLSLARDGEPYSIPVSFGYDGEAVYVPFLVESPDATKTGFVADGVTGRLLVTDVGGRFDWRSVSVTGTMRSVPHDTAAYERFTEALVDNGWFMRSFERADSVETVQAWRLDPDRVEGLERVEEPA